MLYAYDAQLDYSINCNSADFSLHLKYYKLKTTCVQSQNARDNV